MNSRANASKEKPEKSDMPSNKVKNTTYESKIRAKKSIETKADPNSKQRIFHKETIQTTIKKNKYLDNYQFVESRVIRNPKKKGERFTTHIRRGDTFTSQDQINQNGEKINQK